MHLHVQASRLTGTIKIPSSKSHTMRAILFASLAHGQSFIRDYLASPDTTAMIKACRSFGAKIEIFPNVLNINGVNAKPCFEKQQIDVGNSGQVFRFIASIACLDSKLVVIDGDESIRHQRPIAPLLDALNQLGAKASKKDMAQAPIFLEGPLRGGEVMIDGQDSQPVSALLMTCPFLEQPTDIKVNHPGETPWIDLTLDWLNRLNIAYDFMSYSHYRVHGNAVIHAFDYRVPGDFSSLAFPLVAAVVTKSSLYFENIDIHDVQGDKKLIDLLQELGIKIHGDDLQRRLEINASDGFQGFEYDMNQMIDALPILAVLACFASSPSRLFNAAIARKKESDRLSSITKGLRLMGAHIVEEDDALIIYPSSLTGAIVDSHQDHRIAMALIVAGLGASGKTTVKDISCIDKSYPRFVAEFQSIGANLE